MSVWFDVKDCYLLPSNISTLSISCLRLIIILSGFLPRGSTARQRGVWAVREERGDDCQAVEHYRDTQRPLQGKLDTDGQCGDDQVPEWDDSVNKTREETWGRREGREGRLQPQQGNHCDRQIYWLTGAISHIGNCSHHTYLLTSHHMKVLRSVQW